MEHELSTGTRVISERAARNPDGHVVHERARLQPFPQVLAALGIRISHPIVVTVHHDGSRPTPEALVEQDGLCVALVGGEWYA